MSLLKKALFRLELTFHFYKRIGISSFALSIILGFLRYPIEAILAIKIFLIGLVFLYYHFVESKDRLLFYKNFGLTTLAVFAYCIFFDSILSITIFKIFL
tara:strand:- start:1335 stop:1634 length:300 start_codon:yes stop_codon:yes gene_type:complete